MITSIELHNFMSHAHTVIEPHPGLTALVGPNNCGKSAIVAALQALCENADGDYMVRHGENECTVTVKTDDDHVVAWRRIKGKVSYVVDGEEMYKLKRNVPEQVHAALRLPHVVSANASQEFDVHFGAQKSPIFLLNDPASHAATFFASSSDAALLVEMQNIHRKKERDARSRHTQLEKDRANLEAQIEGLRALDDLSTRMAAIESEYKALLAAEEEMKSLRATGKELKKTIRVVERQQAQVVTFTRLPAVPVLEETEPVATLIEEISSIEADALRFQKTIAIASRLAPPPEQADTEALSQLLVSLTRAESHYEREQSVYRSLQGLEEPPSVEDTAALRRMIDDLTQCTKERNEQKKTLKRTEEALASCRKEIDSWVKTQKICPTCGAELDAGRLMEHLPLESGGSGHGD